MDTIIEDDTLPRTVAVVARTCNRTVTAESRFVEDLTFDSIDLVRLVADLEEEFEVIVTEDKLRTMRTVGDAVRVLRSLKNGGATGA